MLVRVGAFLVMNPGPEQVGVWGLSCDYSEETRQSRFKVHFSLLVLLLLI